MTNTCAKDVLDGPTPTDARKEMVKKNGEEGLIHSGQKKRTKEERQTINKSAQRNIPCPNMHGSTDWMVWHEGRRPTNHHVVSRYLAMHCATLWKCVCQMIQ